LDSWHVLDAERRRRAAARQAEWALAHSAAAHRRASELHRWLADRGGPEAATHRAKADRHAADAAADDRRREHLARE
jgi:hypothetical protein